MKVIVFRELKANRKGLLIWMVGMLFMVAIGAAEYGTVVENSESIMQMMDALPRIVKVIFGMDILPIDTPLGYYVCMYLWYCMVAFAHAIVLGATIIAKEERDRTAEFIYTMPYSRKTIISGKIIAAAMNVLCMTIFTFLCIILTLVSQMNGESIMPEILTTMIGMFFAQMLCLALGLFFSSLFKYHRTAMSMAISFFALSFVLATVIEFVGNMEFLNFLTPFRYFFAPYVVTNGISPMYVLLSLFFAGVFVFFTYRLYEKRDIHC